MVALGPYLGVRGRTFKASAENLFMHFFCLQQKEKWSWLWMLEVASYSAMQRGHADKFAAFVSLRWPRLAAAREYRVVRGKTKKGQGAILEVLMGSAGGL